MLAPIVTQINDDNAARSNAKVVVVILGATGHFGRRISRRLAGEKNAQLVLTSRQREVADGLATELRADNPGSEIRGAALDHFAVNFESQLAKLQPDLVIHTAGPYQGQSYRVANACIDCRSHYVDLADGRQFVEEFGSLHASAIAQNVLLVTGASTLPGLSSAVVTDLADEFESISEIEVSIAPAHQTPRGLGTVAAVLSYCGKPFDVLEGGKWIRRFGWQNLRLQRYPGLGTRLSAACDVPDLGLFPKYVPGLRTMTFHAALEAKWEQLALWIMAWAVRLRLISDWARFSKQFQWIGRRLLRFGSVNGGMHMRITGTDSAGDNKIITWYLIAKSNHGPEIPCSPALVIARSLIAGAISERGARHCVGFIKLADFDREVSEFDIEWSVDRTN